MAYKLNSAKDSQGDEDQYVQDFIANQAAIEQYKRANGGDLEHAYQAVTGKPWPAGRSVKIKHGTAEMTKDRTVKSVLGKYVAPIAAGVAAPFILPLIAGAGGAGGAALASGTGLTVPTVSGTAGGLLGATGTIGGMALPASTLGAGTAAATAAGTAAATGGLKAAAGKLVENKLLQGGVAAAAGALPDKSSATSTTTATIDPAFQGLRDRLLALTAQRLNSSADLSGYGASGIQNINHAYDVARQSSDNNLTARGLGTSPVAGAVDQSRENARIGQVAGFQNSLPMLQRDLQAQDLGLGRDLLTYGRGSTTTGNTSRGGGAAGAAGGLAAYLGYLSGKGAFKYGTGAGSTPDAGMSTTAMG